MSVRGDSRGPDFIIIGGMKCGSSTLYRYMRSHPHVFMPERKEIQFFSRDQYFEKGFEWYCSFFSDAAPNQLRGEASTCYSRQWRYPHAAERIAAALPECRLIYIMRHPVERFYSHYRHAMQERYLRKGVAAITLDEFIKNDEEGVEARDASMYSVQISRYLNYFSRERFLFLTLDDLSREPEFVLAKLQDFLELKTVDLTTSGEMKANAAGDVFVRKHVMGRLRRLREIQPFATVANLAGEGARKAVLQNTVEALLRSPFTRGFRNQFLKELSPLEPHLRIRLLREFEKPTCELEAFLGRELAEWHE